MDPAAGLAREKVKGQKLTERWSMVSRTDCLGVSVVEEQNHGLGMAVTPSQAGATGKQLT